MQKLLLIAAAVSTLFACTHAKVDPSAPAKLFGDQAALSARAAGLTDGAEIEYTCGENATYLKVDMKASSAMASVSLPALSSAPQYLACGLTRIGPNCSAGTLNAVFNDLANTVDFTESASGYALTCKQIPPK
jgi:hypothetical protein